MREHKYRAWVKHSKEMVQVGAIQFPDPANLARLSFVVEWNGLRTWTFDEIELLEYIGRKDKKDVEIYDGDIVRINHPQDMTGDFTNAIGQVFWWDEEGGWYHGNGNGRPPKRMWKYVEVIGNVYEHEHLLEQE